MADSVNVKVDGRTYEIARTLGEIDLDNLSREVSESGGHVIWWGVLAAHAHAQYERAKIALDVLRADFGRRIRREKTRLSEKFTERSIEEEIVLTEEYREASERVIESEAQAAILRTVRFALERKQSTLDSMSGALAREVNAGRDMRDPMRDTAFVREAKEAARSARRPVQ